MVFCQLLFLARILHESLATLRAVPQANSQFGGLETAIEAPCSKTCRRDLSTSSSRVAPVVSLRSSRYGEYARPVEFPEGNPIKRGELEHFHAISGLKYDSSLQVV